MSTQDGRTKAALKAMIEGKLLFLVTKDRGMIVDGYIFQVPNSPDQEEYCVMTITSPEQVQRVAKIECKFPHPSWLLRDLGAHGEYQNYKEVSSGSLDAQRVLAMFRAWQTINALRYGQLQLPEQHGPEDTTDISVQFV